MKRYGYYSVRDAKEKLRKVQKMVNKFGKKFDVSKFVYKYYKTCITGSKERVDEFSKVFRVRNIKDWQRNDKLNALMMEVMYDLYLDEVPVHLWVDAEKVEDISVGTFDFKTWNKCRDVSFSLEFNTIIASKKHSATECAIRVLARESTFEKGMIQVSIDYYSEEHGFNFLEPVIIDLNNNKLYISRFNKELNTCKVAFEDFKIDVCPINPKDFKYELETYGDMNLFSIESITIALQNSIKEYFEYVDAVKTIVTVSGAKRKVSKMHEPRVHAIEKVDDTETYVPVSSLAIRKVYEKKPYQGGHHASPIPHEVQGHWRYYKNGKKIWIKPYHKACDKYDKPKRNVNIYMVGK